MKIKTMLFVYCLTAICVYIVVLISCKIYLANERKPSRAGRKYVSEEKIDDKHNIRNVNKFSDRFHVYKLREIKKIIHEINYREHIINHSKSNGSDIDHTIVLVIIVHPDVMKLALFFLSLRHIIGINKSLLIFAHNHYNEEINKVITSLQFGRVLQIFYPYSVQLHPRVYPGQDLTFCHDFGVCRNSRNRSSILSQNKLFWWWVTNQVFDHIDILKNYTGYIYFLETRQYLTNDFIYMARVMEGLRPKYCSECQFLSLGARRPQLELYAPNNSALVVGVWGWSSYSNYNYGFNRTTWNIIKTLKEKFCYFDDASWETSLKYLASNAKGNNFYMLFIEAPRFFPTTGCGAFRRGTDCNLSVIYEDIDSFIPKIKYKFTAHRFGLKFDGSVMSNEVEARGRWGDARDQALCMFISSKASRIYY